MSLTSRTPGKIKQSNLLSLHKNWVQSQEWGFGTDKDSTPRLSKNSALQSFNYPWASQILPSSSFSSPLPPWLWFFGAICQQFPGATSLGPLAMPVLLNQRGEESSLGIWLLLVRCALLHSDDSGFWNSLGMCQAAISKMMVGGSSEGSMCPVSSEQDSETGPPPLFCVIQQHPSRFHTVKHTSVLWHMTSPLASSCKSSPWDMAQALFY